MNDSREWPVKKTRLQTASEWKAVASKPCAQRVGDKDRGPWGRLKMCRGKPRMVKKTVKPHTQMITLNKLELSNLIQNVLFCSKDLIKELMKKILLGSY